MISIVLTIHNQADILPFVFEGIDKSSNLVKEFIVIFDGCTDTSEQCFSNWYVPNTYSFEFKVLHLPNVFETRANNAGLKEVTQPYAIIVQDDCAIKEFFWDKQLLEPALKWSNVFAVSGRNGHSIIPSGDIVDYTNVVGWGTNKNDPNKFYVSQVVNRGPLLLKMEVVKQLNYFDEAFVPQNGDDHDLCLRAYREGYICGCRPIDFVSERDWGGTRKGNGKWIADAIDKNMRIIHNRYIDLISRDYPVEERDL